VEEIFRLAAQFREAIEMAKNEHKFIRDMCFGRFPRGCCGDASVLLAHYLLKRGIQTTYICGNYYDDEVVQSHAWLELSDGVIVDITGDQFKYDKVFLNYNVPVYVGKMDAFHALFDVEARDVRKSVSIEKLGDICYPRLIRLYDTIIGYVEIEG
jgi:hypothetical protein